MATNFTISGMPNNTPEIIGKIYEAAMRGRIQFNAQDGQPYVLGTPQPFIPGVGIPGQTTPALPSVGEWVGDILGFYFARCYEITLQADVQALQQERMATAASFRKDMEAANVMIAAQQPEPAPVEAA